MTTTPIAIATPYQQIIDRAHVEIKSLDKSQAGASARLAALQSEQDTLEARRQARASELTALFETASHAQARADALSARERLAEGTEQEGKLTGQVKAAEKEKNQAAQALARFQARSLEEETADTARAAQIEQERAELQGRLEDIATSRRAIEAAMTTAYRDMGEVEWRDFQAQHEAALARVAEARQHLEETEAALAQLLSTGPERLSGWEDLKMKAEALIPYEDATTRILSAYLGLLETLATDGPAMPWRIQGYNPAAQVEVTAGFVEALMQHRRENDAMVANRRYGAKKMLEMHLASVGKAGNPLA